MTQKDNNQHLKSTTSLVIIGFEVKIIFIRHFVLHLQLQGQSLA